MKRPKAQSVERHATLVVAGGLLAASIAAAALALAPAAMWREWIVLVDQDETRHALSPRGQYWVRACLLAAGAALAIACAATLRFRHHAAAGLRRIAGDAAHLAAAARDGMRKLLAAPQRPALAALILALAGGAAIRLAWLSTPLEYDEVYTYLFFASRDLINAVSNYSVPNNHIFHTILVQLSTSFFGNGPLALRLPALLAGLAVIPASFAVGARLFGFAAGGAAALLVAAAYPMIRYSGDGRGYTWLVLFFLLAWLAADVLRRRDNAAAWLVLVAATALGTFTIPIMVYPAGIVFLWALWETEPSRRRAAFAWLVTAGLCAIGATTVLYGPAVVRSGMRSLVANDIVAPLPWEVFAGRIGPRMIEVYQESMTFVPVGFQLLLGVAFVIALFPPGALSRTARRTVLVTLAWTALVTVSRRVVPFDRVFIFLIPVASVAAGWGLVRLMEWGRVRAPVRRDLAASAVAAAVLLVVVARAGLILRGPPHEVRGAYSELPAAVADVGPQLRPGEAFLAAIPWSEPLRYHVIRGGLPRNMVYEYTRRSGGWVPPCERLYVVRVREPYFGPATGRRRDGSLYLDDAGLDVGWQAPVPVAEYRFIEVLRLDRSP